MSFWKKLAKPFFLLAPMADVTDPAFRRVIAKYGKPDAMWTEFVSGDGLILAPEEGRKKLLADLQYSPEERPIVAQFFTGKPEIMEKVAALAVQLGFDGVDINMGCPDKSIEKQKAGAALMKDPKRAKEIIAAAVRGGAGLPVSVKTRIGYNKDELDSWLPYLLETDLAVITFHARTRKEMSSVPAHWDRVTRAVDLRDKLNPKVLILGNGDVKDLAEAGEKVAETGADGIMLGRAIFGNPFLFSSLRKEKRPERPEGVEGPSIEERLKVMVEHTKLFEKLLPHKNFAIMKKHYKAYVNGFPGAAELRGKLMETVNAEEVKVIINDFVLHSP
ncbi:tRNA-dihydrouridine synthase [Candidatus Kaiserbacteria bacterium]|nr:tRNA-dihydrouridine synthase [Candidatus Kaiserbacteria bacterium]